MVYCRIKMGCYEKNIYNIIFVYAQKVCIIRMIDSYIATIIMAFCYL